MVIVISYPGIFMCFSVNGTGCLVCSVFDSVCELFDNQFTI